MTNAFVRMNVRVHGNVHGVGYRAFAQRQACAEGLVGYVRNLSDGSVEVVAEGPRNPLRRYLEALDQGPEGAEVHALGVRWEAARSDLDGFQIRCTPGYLPFRTLHDKL